MATNHIPPSSPETGATLTEDEVITKPVDKKMQQPIPTHHAEAPKLTELVPEPMPLRATSTEKDNAEEEEAYQRTASQLREMLEQKNQINPETEFAQAKDFDMTEVRGGLFSGVFTDSLNKFNLAVVADENSQLSSESCAEIQEGHFFQPPKLKIKTTDDYFAVIMIGDRYYARLGAELNRHRLLIGKLYQKQGTQWVFVSAIEAQELRTRKIPETCKFR